MSNTYLSMYLHLVFAVKYRLSLLPPALRPHIHALITDQFTDCGHTPIIIGGTADHVHALISYNPAKAVADTMRKVKGASSRYINEKRLTVGRFEWQRGYACFTCSADRVPQIINYIHNQEYHHSRFGFNVEIRQLLDGAGVLYDERYLMKEPK